MASNILHLLLLSLLLCSSSSSHIPESYIIYMGGSIGESDTKLAELGHLQLLKTVIPREEEQRIMVKHVYHHALRGFSALLTEEEASILSGHDEVVSVFRDPMLKLHTTRSWDFLNEQSGFSTKFHYQHGSSDVIIGIIDTGIWPESPSFSDKGYGPIPRRWKGVCMESSDFKKSNCNRKIIGARHYGKGSSARDTIGHGTHTASTAAGILVPNASYHGLAQGTARGGLPSARIAVYKPCDSEGCAGAKLIKAIDDAVKDGVDIISISIGTEEEPDLLLNDPIAIASFHASQFGKFVICSAGNSGPKPYTIVNTSPWIFTVAASSIDRVFESKVVLGNKEMVNGYGISFSNHTSFGHYPLVFSRDVALSSATSSEASNCYPGSLNSKKVAGKLVVCLNKDPSLTRRIKMLVAQDAGARGVIYISDEGKDSPPNSGEFPITQIGETDGKKVLRYISSDKRPTATIIPTVMVARSKPAPIIAEFSSRGPGKRTENILKPDIMAPGVSILASLPPSDEEPIASAGSPNFGLRSGTSMACPHVSGAAAFIKSVHPQWTPSMIKSALMTTAITSNNERRVFTNTSGEMANPHEAGVGEISPLRALDPGLIFPTTTQDYLHYLCYLGFSKKDIKSISSTSYDCPKVSKKLLISKINYPSISIGKLKRNHGRKITRHVVNVGSLLNTTYVSTVDAPKGLSIKVNPEKLTFYEGSKTTSFNVYIRGKQANKGYNYGSIKWCDGKHIVRMVFAINIVG